MAGRLFVGARAVAGSHSQATMSPPSSALVSANAVSVPSNASPTEKPAAGGVVSRWTSRATLRSRSLSPSAFRVYPLLPHPRHSIFILSRMPERDRDPVTPMNEVRGVIEESVLRVAK